MKTVAEVICDPEKIIAKKPDFFTSATKGAVVAEAMTVLMEAMLLMTDFSPSVMLGDLSKNQLIVPLLEYAAGLKGVVSAAVSATAGWVFVVIVTVLL